MIRQVLSRVVLFGVASLLLFALLDLAPGDFATALDAEARVSTERIQDVRRQYGLDRPFLERWGTWASGVLRGELGRSYVYGVPVTGLLLPRVGRTLVLAGVAVMLSWLLALSLGTWSARGVDAASLAVLSIPDLVIALALAAAAARAGWSGHIAVPVTALVLATTPALIRQVRSAFRNAMEQPFVRIAQANRMSPRRVLFRYTLPAAAPPLIGVFAVSIGSLLSTSLLVECISGWPGLGPLLLEAVFARDLPLVAGAMLASTALWTASSVAADLILSAADPRVRA